jgi:hypothetical protein
MVRMAATVADVTNVVDQRDDSGNRELEVEAERQVPDYGQHGDSDSYERPVGGLPAEASPHLVHPQGPFIEPVGCVQRNLDLGNLSVDLSLGHACIVGCNHERAA